MDEIKYGTSSGYIILGMLMLAVAGFCLTPNNITIESMNAFRYYGGATMILIGLVIIYLYKDSFSSFIMILNGLMFILAAEVSLTSSQDFAMIVFIVGYALTMIVALLKKEPSMMVAIIMLLIMLNVLFRYVFGVADDGTAMISGVFCILSALLSMYVGIAMTSERVNLPIR